MATCCHWLTYFSLFLQCYAVEVPRKLLNDGNMIPILALGTYHMVDDTHLANQSVIWAIEAGYRHIDTASIYMNEGLIGNAVKDVIKRGLVKREDLFVTTKLPPYNHYQDQVVPALRGSLSRLGLDYVDLYLIHSPMSRPPGIDILETWKGMEQAQRLGLTKSIGVSNFNIEQIDRVVAHSHVTPAVNQVEVHPASTREVLVSHCHSLGIAVMAYSPFGYLVDRGVLGEPNPPPPHMDDPLLLTLAKKYGKKPTQIVLRYLIDRGLIPIPKSSKRHRIIENINIFDFSLTSEEVAKINKFNSNTPIFGWPSERSTVTPLGRSRSYL